ncbi:MAG: hypothetical protein H6822_21775 [Planctomycetaceae bacterium]|nr:hypothetical protein [Planctomycetales bacterium]MCB9924826.1 hypothetical protein [Planctomycetaceae bacterium]
MTLVILGLFVASTQAQPPVHYFHNANLPPGTVAYGQLQRHMLMREYYQPVEVAVPKGARVSVNVGGQFDDPHEATVLVGMQIGPVYQLKISNIPYYEGFEIFPTIEVINRLYPPEGKAGRFPIPIQFTQEELELALSGRYVTRVVYLEDRDTALPVQDDPAQQRYFEAGPGQDPLQVADTLGRPMLIMRMGSRVPSPDDLAIGAHGAPAIVYESSAVPAIGSTDAKNAIERPGYNIPRVEVPNIGRPPQIPFVVPQSP